MQEDEEDPSEHVTVKERPNIQWSLNPERRNVKKRGSVTTKPKILRPSHHVMVRTEAPVVQLLHKAASDALLFRWSTPASGGFNWGMKT